MITLDSFTGNKLSISMCCWKAKEKGNAQSTCISYIWFNWMLWKYVVDWEKYWSILHTSPGGNTRIQKANRCQLLWIGRATEMIWGDKGWDLFDLYFLLLHRILIILHYNLYNLGILLHNTRTSLQRLASSKQPITEDDLFPDVENLNTLFKLWGSSDSF